jgi:hypothetical protein
MNGLEKEGVVPKSWRLRSGQPLLCLAKISKGQFALGLWLKDQAAPCDLECDACRLIASPSPATSADVNICT